MHTKHTLPATRPTGILKTFELLKTPIFKEMKKYYEKIFLFYLDVAYDFLWVCF